MLTLYTALLLAQITGVGHRQIMASGGSPVSYSGTNALGNGTNTTINVNITVSGTRPLLVVNASESTALASISAITWSLGSGAVAQAGTIVPTSSYNLEIWCIVAPTAGAGTVAITVTGLVEIDVELWNNASACPSGDSTDGTGGASISLTPTGLTASDATVGDSGTCVDDSNAMTPNSVAHVRSACDLDTGYNTGTSGITASFTSGANVNAAVAVRIQN